MTNNDCFHGYLECGDIYWICVCCWGVKAPTWVKRWLYSDHNLFCIWVNPEAHIWSNLFSFKQSWVLTKTCAMSCSCIDHYYDSYFNSCCNEFRTVIGGWFGLKWCTLISSKKKRADALFLLPILPLFPLCFWAEMELLKVTHSRLGCFQLDKDVSVLQGTKVVHTQKPQKSECNEISYVQVVNKREISSSQAESRHKSVNILYTNFDYSLKLKGMDRAG